MKIRDFVCGVYTLLCALLQWASDSGIATPFVNLCSNIWGALWQFCCELYYSSMWDCISSMGGCICKPFKDMFMKGFNFVKCLGSMFIDTCKTVIVGAMPNMCLIVALLVLTLDMNTYNSTILGVYDMQRAKIWMQGIDKWAGANCQCLKLVRSMDIVALSKCTATSEEEGVKGLLSQQVCEMLNYCVVSSMVYKDKDVLVANTLFRGYSILNGQTTTLSTWQTTARWLFYNTGWICGLFNHRQDFWTYYHGVLLCITLFAWWCFYMRLHEFTWQKAMFEYCTVGAWLQMFLLFMGEYTIKSIFPQWSGAQDNTTDNENPSTPQGTCVTWGATNTSYPAHTPSQHQTLSKWTLQSIQARMPATQHGARQVSPRAESHVGFVHAQFPFANEKKDHQTAAPFAQGRGQTPLYQAASSVPPALDTRRSTSATERTTRTKSPAKRRRTPTATRSLY
jgi:hypothetical protein